MKKTFLLPILLIASLGTLGYGQTSGTPFSSPKGFFTVRMPGLDPKEESANDGLNCDGSLTSIDGKTTYAVEYRCYCNQVDQPEEASKQFIRIIAELQTRTGGTVVGQSDLVLRDSPDQLEGHPGKEVKIEFGSTSATYHIYLADTRTFVLSVTTEKTIAPTGASDFFGSFHRGVDPQAVKDYPKFVPSGVPGGIPGGVPGGVPGGIPGSVPGGVPGPVGGVKSPDSKDPLTKTLSRSEGVIKGNAIRLVTPVYPRLAVAGRVQGKVEVDILIDEDGKVISAVARCGHPLLVRAALQAARDSLFKPTLLAGVPVKIQGVLTYNFAF